MADRVSAYALVISIVYGTSTGLPIILSIIVRRLTVDRDGRQATV